MLLPVGKRFDSSRVPAMARIYNLKRRPEPPQTDDARPGICPAGLSIPDSGRGSSPDSGRGSEIAVRASGVPVAGSGARGMLPGPSRCLPGPENRLSGGRSDPKKAGFPGKSPVAGGAGPRPAGLVNCAISERNPTADFLKFAYDSAPVRGFLVLKNDVVTVRAARFPDELAARLEGAERGKIEFLSMKSRRRLALLAGNSDVIFRSFVTLSYPAAFPCDGLLVKRHLHAVLAALRRKCPGLSYLWFLEFQRRGAPHLHLFLSAALPSPLGEMKRGSGRVRKSVKVHWPWQDWLASRWFEIVGSGDPLHLKAGTAWEAVEKPDGAARYISKESYKTWQKQVPAGFQNVGRFWGCSRDVSAPVSRQVFCSESDMRKIFPSSCFDSEGNPYPVIFGGAAEYRKIMDSADDPVKVRTWKRTAKNQTPSLLRLESGFDIIKPSFPKSRKTAKQILACAEFHGSTLNG
jgi:hypothetical protein